MDTQQRDLTEIDATMLLIQDARARACEAAAALRAHQARRDLIDHIEGAERRLNQAVQELLPLRYC